MEQLKEQKQWLADKENQMCLTLSLGYIEDVTQHLISSRPHMCNHFFRESYWKLIETNKDWYQEIFETLTKFRYIQSPLERGSEAYIKLYTILMHTIALIALRRDIHFNANSNLQPFDVAKIRSIKLSFPLLYDALELDEYLAKHYFELEFKKEA